MRAGAGAERRERRARPRTRRIGSAIVYLNPWLANEYAVEDLSAGGALLTCGPPIRVGRNVRLVLRVLGFQPIAVDAKVLRRADGLRDGVAVAFVDLEAAVEDLIQDVVLANLCGHRSRARAEEPFVDWAADEGSASAWLG
jgi:hypothetical protein